jgi:large subunit ribosomal protein L30
MLRKVKDYVTWGPIDAETASLLVKERGLLEGRKSLDEKSLKALGSFKSFDDLGKAIADGKTTWSKLDGTIRVFRLHPPRKGYEGIKRSYTVGGALGDRGEDINALLQRMM